MFRFTLFPFIIIISTLLSGLVTYFFYRTVKRTIVSTYKKGAELAAEKQQQWKDKENRKQFPEMLLKGFETYDNIDRSIEDLPEAWYSQLQPLRTQAKQILDELAFNVESVKAHHKNADHKQYENKKNDIINSMRTFFIHTLDALQQFTDKISQDVNHMSDDQITKAQQNIQVLAADLEHHQTLLDKKRKFDFDVLMDVIKARLKT